MLWEPRQSRWGLETAGEEYLVYLSSLNVSCHQDLKKWSE